MTHKQTVMREWVVDNSNITGNSINDYYIKVRDIALECSSTRVNRNGHNDKSFIGPERMLHLWNNRKDVVNIVSDYYANSPKKQDKIDQRMTKFDNDIIYIIYRFFHSNRSPEMIKRYKNKIKSSPGNNGRQRAGQLLGILVSMKNINYDSGLKTDTYKFHIDNGSKLLGTNKKVFTKTSKGPRVVNLNTQPTVKKITIDSKIIHEID